MALRKKLHNELVDLKGNIRVFGRVRPIIHEDGGGEEAKVMCSFDREDDQLVYVQNKVGKRLYENRGRKGKKIQGLRWKEKEI